MEGLLSTGPTPSSFLVYVVIMVMLVLMVVMIVEFIYMPRVPRCEHLVPIWSQINLEHQIFKDPDYALRKKDFCFQDPARALKNLV